MVGKNVSTPRSHNLTAAAFSCFARICTAYQFSTHSVTTDVTCGNTQASLLMPIASPSKQPGGRFNGSRISLLGGFQREVPRLCLVQIVAEYFFWRRPKAGIQ